VTHLTAVLRNAEIEMTPVESRGTLSIAADVRLDTRDDLTRALSCPADVSDAQVLLAAYAAWGEGMLDRLVGDFAFVLWDATARRLVCARDQLGVRPLYWTSNAGTVRCASRIADLVRCSDVPRDLDPVRMADYLALASPAPDATFFSRIHRVPAGACLIVEHDGRTRGRQYWTPDGTREVRLSGGAAYADEFRDLLTASVRSRLGGAGRLACALSGGLDSSSIYCVARGLAPAASIQPVSLLFEQPDGTDDRRFIDEVLRRSGSDARRIHADGLDPWRDTDATLDALGEPFSPANLFLHLALYRETAAARASVLLDGFDGDTVVSHGLLRLLDLTRQWRLGAALKEAGAAARIGRAGRWRVLARYGLRPAAPMPIRTAWRAARRRRHARDLTFASRAFATRLREPRRAGAVPRTARAAHCARLADPSLACTFEVAAAAAATFGVEPRYPFFDRRLVEFCLGVPAERQLHGGWTRAIHRHAMRGILPAAVRWRRHKADFTGTFARGFNRGIRMAFDRLSAGDTRLAAEHVDIGQLRDIAGQAETDAATANAAWHAMTLARWLQRQESGGI